jgi:hypothetical protein
MLKKTTLLSALALATVPSRSIIYAWAEEPSAAAAPSSRASLHGWKYRCHAV